MKAELLSKNGDDLLVVNAARVSFAKESKLLSSKDENLIDFLAEHKHFLPFRHPQMTLRCSAPMFVARQLGKYQVGFSWSEESRRYITEEPSFHYPAMWRVKAADKKQGSVDLPVKEPLRPRMSGAQTTHEAYNRFVEISYDFYKELLDADVCPEQARMVLPQSMHVNWIWTGSLLGFVNICKERLQPDAQKETREFVRLIYGILKQEFPYSTKALLGDL